jgi:type I restriction enzyme S subunit
MVRGNLPDAWECKTIEDAVDSDGVFIDGDWVESKDQDPNGEVRLIQLADVGDGYYRNRSNRFLTHKKALELGCTFLKKGDLLIARMPDPLGRACIFPGDVKQSVTVVDVCIVRTKGTDHRWLMHAINSPQFRADVESLQSGSTRKRISRKNLSKLTLPIPPLPEQERIVSRIEELFSDLEAGVAALERVRAGLRRYKASVLKAAVEGKLVKGESGMGEGELPERWSRATVGEIAAKVTDGTHKTPKYVDEGVPFISVNNISLDGVIDFSNCRYISPEEHKELFRRCNPEQGDVLLTKVGTVGLTAVVKTDVEFSLFVNTALIKPLLETVSPDYLAHALRFGFFSKSFEGFVSGSTQKFNVTQKISQLPIPLPPLDEQRRIVAEFDRRLSVVREVESAVQAGLVRAGRLRQAVLRSAFEGRL